MANPCCLAMAQAPAQAFLRPGMAIPGLRNLHLATEVWRISADKAAARDAVVNAVNEVEEKENLILRRKEDDKLTIWSFTPRANWLDIVEIEFAAPTSEEDSAGTLVNARSFSSGLFPACCPLAFVFNCIFCWVPFSGNGFNSHRLEAIRKAIKTEMELVEQGPSCC